MKVPKPVKVSIKKLKNEYDFIFSWYVRLVDARSDGLVECFTCGKAFTPIDIQAGHYWSRTHSIIRWHEANVKPQCKNCNCSIYGKGKPQEFALHLTELYGGKVLTELEDLKKVPCKMKSWELQEKIALYKDKVEQLLYNRLYNRPSIQISKKLEKYLNGG